MVETWRGPTRIRSASGVSSCYSGRSIALGCMLPLTGYEALVNLMAYLLCPFFASQKPERLPEGDRIRTVAAGVN